jgi:hypothetical protein
MVLMEKKILDYWLYKKMQTWGALFISYQKTMHDDYGMS